MNDSRSDPAARAHQDRPDSFEEVVLRGGDRVLIRPIQVHDKEPERHFIEGLSDASRRFRFLDTIKAPSEMLLRRLTVLDPTRDVAFVGVIDSGIHEEIVGVGRFSAGLDGKDCEFALTISDAWQEKGLASHLMRRLIAVASARGIKCMHSSDASDNERMRKFAAHAHLQHQTDPEDARLVRYSIDIQRDPTRLIDLKQTNEVSGWCRSLGCTENALKSAVATVGNSSERVREYLTGSRQSLN